jgi:RNA polymerase sigma-70 factor, ECF subfamily
MGVRMIALPHVRKEPTMISSEVNPAARRLADADLVQRAQQGDVDAFAALFHANKTRIYSLCLRMTGNTAEAEDLTQEAFLLAFRKLGTFRGDSALSTWLYRVAVNTVLMHIRKKGMRVRESSLDELNERDPHAPKAEHGDVDERLVSAVDRVALTRAIKVLPAGYRRVFLMHEVHGYEHQEIARILRCSIGNSKSQLHKAKAKMRELLHFCRPQAGPHEVPAARAHNATKRGPATVASFKPEKQPAWDAPHELAA